MLGPLRRDKPPREALARVKAWTRARFSLAPDAPVLVAEIACALPGCPPRETVVVFWTEGERRHRYKVFKPVAEVAEDDLPPAFMRNALAETEAFGCDCC